MPTDPQPVLITADQLLAVLIIQSYKAFQTQMMDTTPRASRKSLYEIIDEVCSTRGHPNLALVVDMLLGTEPATILDWASRTIREMGPPKG